MALNKNIKYVNQITQDEHDDTANVEVKKSGEYGWDADSLEWKRIAVDANGQQTVAIDPTGLDLATQTTLASIDTNVNTIDTRIVNDIDPKLDDISTNTSAIVSNTQSIIDQTIEYSTNDIDDVTTTDVVYIGAETGDGVWQVKKIDSSGSFPIFRYASVSNNALVSTYSDAWTARVTLTYDIYELA